MNRIILIGNGFDLAHGYPTRYEDFINWYLNKMGKKIFMSNERSESTPFFSVSLKDIISLGSLNAAFSYYHIKSKYYKDFINEAKKHPDICEYKDKSALFSQISKTIQSKGWVDIEQEYYDLLCKYIKDPDNCKYTLSELNDHLHFLRSLLIEYLTFLKISQPQLINDAVYEKIYSPINKDDICISQLSAFWNYLESILQQKYEYRDLLSKYGLIPHVIDGIIDYINILKKHYKGPAEYNGYSLNNIFYPKHILLLNFNYTTLADNYKKRVSSIIHIHGIQYWPASIVFGYGDELDDDYKDLLKQNDNECLRNIKSIKYLEADNYRNMLRFIESAPYQVCIMGHSCGNSDRTLLNTLFEHKNCVSIKPYYYQKEDGSDNYMEIVQNICRNFTDMKLMRDRVVNKTFCEPLPQVKR